MQSFLLNYLLGLLLFLLLPCFFLLFRPEGVERDASSFVKLAKELHIMEPEGVQKAAHDADGDIKHMADSEDQDGHGDHRASGGEELGRKVIDDQRQADGGEADGHEAQIAEDVAEQGRNLDHADDALSLVKHDSSHENDG